MKPVKQRKSLRVRIESSVANACGGKEKVGRSGARISRICGL